MTTIPVDRASAALQRITPLAGVLAAGVGLAGDLVIGPFPEGTTDGAHLHGYYTAHGPQVALGATLLVWSALCLGVFGLALWARVRAAVPPLVAGLILLGSAVETAVELQSAGIFSFLGEHGADGRVAPAALQAWQLGATEIGSSGGLVLVLVGVGAAALAFRALPRWLGVPALLLGVALFTPWFFLASLLVLLWAAVAGIALAVRPGASVRTLDPVAVPVG